MFKTSRFVVFNVRKFSSASQKTFQHLILETPKPYVVHVKLNRPEKRNALNLKLWDEIGECFNYLAENPDCRSVVLSGSGKCFTAGIDLNDIMALMQTINSDQLDAARKGRKLRAVLKNFQNSFTAIEKCPKPVIAAVHGLCLGGGMGILTATDIRYATSDAFFQIKEVELGIAADVGHLQRLPKIISNDSACKELAITGRMFGAEEAYKLGLCSRLFATADDLMLASLELATLIASKSPVAVQGTKVNMNFSRDHTVEDSLEFIANWNAAMLQTEDLIKAASAIVTKQTEAPDFSKF